MHEGLKESGEVESYFAQLWTTTGAIASGYQSIYPNWHHIKVVTVACSTYEDYGMCPFIRVGGLGWKPPKKIINEMAKELLKFGLVELSPIGSPRLGRRVRLMMSECDGEES
jgi:hypothetical protein